MIIRRPGDSASSPPNSPGRAVTPYDHAREAAKEKKRSQYIELACGHFTTWEADEQVSVFRPAKGKFFCEVHGKWVEKKRRPRRQSYPQEPLF